MVPSIIPSPGASEMQGFQRNRRPPIVDSLTATAAVALAILVRLALGPALGERQPYATFYVSVLFAALTLGLGPAVLAAVLGLIAGVYFFVVPFDAFFISDPADLMALATYVLVTVGTIWLCESNRRVLRRLGTEAEHRRRSERAERAQRERLEALLESLGEGVIVAGADGRIALLNPVAEQLTAWPAAEAIGRPLGEVLQIRAPVASRAEGPPEAAGPGGGIVLLRQRDETEVPVELSSAAIRGTREGGRVLIVRDVSDRQRNEEAERAGRVRLRLALEAGRLSAWDWDLRTGRIEWAEHGTTLYGLEAGSLDGTVDRFRALIDPRDVDTYNAAVASALEGQDRFEAEYRLCRPDGSCLWLADRGRVIRDDEGHAIRMIGISADVNDRKRVEQSARFLADAGSALATLVDEDEALRKVAHLAVPFFADWAAVDLADPDETLRRVAVAHVDPAKVELARELQLRYPPDPTAPYGPPWVLLTGQPDMTAEIPDTMLADAAVDDEHLRILRELGLRSFLCVPLRSRDQLLGVITFVTAESGRRFGPADLAMAEDLAHRATVALENSRLYAELRESEQRFRQLAEHITDVFYVADAAGGRMLYISPGYEATWGRTCQSLHDDPRSFLESIHAEDRPRIVTTLDRQLGGEATAEEYRIVRPDGAIRWIFDRAFPIRDEAGQISRIAGIAEDVTDRKRVEAELRASEGRFRMLAEAVPQIVWTSTLDGGLEYVNRRWFDYVGLEPQPPGGVERWREFFHPDDREEVLGLLQEAHRTGGVFEAEYRLRDRSGAYRWHLGRSVPVLDDRGRVDRWVGTATDIDARKRAERTLRLLADAGILLADPTALEGTISRIPRLVIPGLADSCVVYLAEAGGPIRRVAIAHRDPTLQVLMAEALEGSEIDPLGPSPVAQVLRTGRPDLRPELDRSTLDALVADPERRERLRPVQPTSHLIVPMIAGGRTIGAFGLAMTGSGRRFGPDDLPVAEDLARRAAIALENARLYQELREADRRKDEFLAMLAHELRNPLAPIRTCLELLRPSGPESGTEAIAERESIRAMASRQVVHMARLIDDLMDVSRISRGTIELRPEPVELATLVRSVVGAIGPQLAEARQDLSISLPDRPCWLQADPARLEQVLWNLLANAAKYSDPGGRIELVVDEDEGGATILVRDRGLGIDPGLLPRIFELFVQADRGPARRRGGLGIGLSLVRALVELHGGTIVARSPGLGLGSEFLVRLPVPAVPAAGPSGRAVETADGPGATPSRRRILLVDDNRDAAVSLGKLLVRLGGHEVRLAHDGPEALEVAADYEPEVVLLDIGLPGMDGFEVARRLRATAPGSVAMLVALTGWGQQEDRRRSREAGFDHHLVKPVDPAVIDGLIASSGPRIPADA